MDETALLACGILLEEAAKELLGENGDMVFTEPDKEGLFNGGYQAGSTDNHRPSARDHERQHKRPRLDHEGSPSADSLPATQNNDSEFLGSGS